MTFSLLALDPQTGRMGVAVASYAKIDETVPHLQEGIGAVATQGIVNPAFGHQGIALLSSGASPRAAVDALSRSDRGRDVRQFHLMDATGKAAAYTGEACPGWAGHRIGNNLSAAGNTLTGSEVLDAAFERYREQRTQGNSLPECLLAALRAAADQGGDRRGLRSAALFTTGGTSQRPVKILIRDSSQPLLEVHRYLLRAQGGSASTPSFSFSGQPGQQSAFGQQKLKQQLVTALRGQPSSINDFGGNP